MKKRIIALSILMSMFSTAAHAINVDAESTAVIELSTRQIIYGMDCHKHLPMASTTKIMTAAIALENGNTMDYVNISENAQNQEGSSIYLRVGDRVTLRDLLYGLMLNSGNDAAVAIAEHIGGNTEHFVQMMNDKASELGCRDTHFMNPSGLFDAEHYSSAYDMALIMAYAMENEEFKNIISTKEYQIKTAGAITYLRNHNKLLWQYDGCIGGKTGFTKNSGRCLVSCAEKDGIAVAAVTLNDRNDWNDHKNLFDHAFSTVSQKEILEKNDIICTRHICGKRVNLLAGEDFSVAHVSGRNNRISCKVYINEDISGDIFVGTRVGSAQIYCGKYLLGTIPLVSGQEISNYRKFFGENFERILKSALLRQKKGQSLILCNPQNWLQNDNMI